MAEAARCLQLQIQQTGRVLPRHLLEHCFGNPAILPELLREVDKGAGVSDAQIAAS